MSKEVKNYTDAQEARLREFDFIDNARALELAAEFGKDVRSIRAKAVTMKLYRAKVKTSKSGGAVESKEDIVAEIGSLIGRNLEGLEKAGKTQLQAIRDYIAA